MTFESQPRKKYHTVDSVVFGLTPEENGRITTI